MPKLDLKKEYREFYNPSARKCSLVDVPEMQFLMVDGSGDPNTSEAYQDAIGAHSAVNVDRRSSWTSSKSSLSELLPRCAIPRRSPR